MAAPVVRGRTAPVAGLATTATTATQVGDIVVVATWERNGAGAATHTIQAGYNQIANVEHNDGSTDGRLSIAWTRAASAGSANYQAFTSSAGQTAATLSIVITGTDVSTGGITMNANSQVSSALPDPPISDTFASSDRLILVFAGWHLSASATVTPTAPTNWTNLQHLAGASLLEFASAERGMTAQTAVNPGTFGDDVTPNGTLAITVTFQNAQSQTSSAALALGPTISTIAQETNLGVVQMPLGPDIFTNAAVEGSAVTASITTNFGPAIATAASETNLARAALDLGPAIAVNGQETNLARSESTLGPTIATIARETNFGVVQVPLGPAIAAVGRETNLATLGVALGPAIAVDGRETNLGTVAVPLGPAVAVAARETNHGVVTNGLGPDITVGASGGSQPEINRKHIHRLLRATG